MPREQKRSKTRKGGQKVRFDRLDKKREPIREHRDDCGPSVFYMLGYTDLETTRYLASRATDGLFLHGEVVAMLQLAYGDIRVDTLTEDSLLPNDATLAFIVWEDKGEKAHYFIVFTNDKSIQENLTVLSTIKYDFNNTVGPKSISKQELIVKFNPLFLL